jgi:hypothetical protein
MARSSTWSDGPGRSSSPINAATLACVSSLAETMIVFDCGSNWNDGPLGAPNPRGDHRDAVPPNDCDRIEVSVEHWHTEAG